MTRQPTAPPVADETPAAPVIRRRRAPRLRGVLRNIAALWLFVAIIAAWWVLSAGSSSTFFPPLKDIVQALYDLWIVGDTKGELPSSLQNFALGYAIAAVGGVVFGALLWSLRPVKEAVSPYIYFLYVLPAPVLIPAAMTMFGIGSAMKVVIIAFAAVWPTLLNTLDGMRGVDPIKLDTARVLGLSGFRVVRSVVLPAALPQIVAGLRNSLQVAIILMVVSELIASTSGIGFFILQAQQSFAFIDMWTGVLVLAAVGSALNLLFVLIENRVLFWHYGARATEEKR
jgi:sulfonate transport system permease protein